MSTGVDQPQFFGGDRYERLLKIPALALGFLVVGPGMLYTALRRRIVVFVETERTTRKLGFGATVDPDELAQFVGAVRTAGLDVEVNVDMLSARARVRPGLSRRR